MDFSLSLFSKFGLAGLLAGVISLGLMWGLKYQADANMVLIANAHADHVDAVARLIEQAKEDRAAFRETQAEMRKALKPIWDAMTDDTRSKTALAAGMASLSSNILRVLDELRGGRKEIDAVRKTVGETSKAVSEVKSAVVDNPDK